MLDFYESLTVLVKVIAAMKGAYEELNEVHRPDNGLTHSASGTMHIPIPACRTKNGERLCRTCPLSLLSRG
jgi:hypothetical protein